MSWNLAGQGFQNGDASFDLNPPLRHGRLRRAAYRAGMHCRVGHGRPLRVPDPCAEVPGERPRAFHAVAQRDRRRNGQLFNPGVTPGFLLVASFSARRPTVSTLLEFFEPLSNSGKILFSNFVFQKPDLPGPSAAGRKQSRRSSPRLPRRSRWARTKSPQAGSTSTSTATLSRP